jgi:DNA-binding response OmpR family regulator
MTLGASAYLGKPFEPEQLKATVRTLLPASPAGG